MPRAHFRFDSYSTSLRRFADGAVELQLAFLADYKTLVEYTRLMSDLHLALKEAFDKAGIGFPTQTVYLQKEQETQAPC